MEVNRIEIKKTRCQPSNGYRCIAAVILENEGSMMQTCQKIVHYLTQIYVENYMNVNE